MTQGDHQCLSRDRLVIPNVIKSDAIWGAGKLSKTDITRGQASSTGMPHVLRS